MVKAFSDLTERGRARRLRFLALAALADYELEVSRLRLITNSWNCVFRAATASGPKVVRVTLPGYGHGVRMVEAETGFMAALAEGSDLSLPGVVPNRRGELVTLASAVGVPEPRSCVVFDWVPGRVLGDDVTPNRWESLGELAARMHFFAESWSPPPDFDVITYDRVFHYAEPCVLFEPGRVDLLGLGPLLAEALAVTDDRIGAILEREQPMVTHGDLHQWNVLVHRDELTPIDFEDVQFAPPILDVATTLFYVRFHPAYPTLGRAFRSGYERHRRWVETVPGELDRLFIARSLDLLNIVALQPEIEVDDWPEFVGRREEIAKIALGDLPPVVL